MLIANRYQCFLLRLIFRLSEHSGIWAFNSSIVLNFFTQVLQKITVPGVLCNDILCRASDLMLDRIFPQKLHGSETLDFKPHCTLCVLSVSAQGNILKQVRQKSVPNGEWKMVRCVFNAPRDKVLPQISHAINIDCSEFCRFPLHKWFWCDVSFINTAPHDLHYKIELGKFWI